VKDILTEYNGKNAN